MLYCKRAWWCHAGSRCMSETCRCGINVMPLQKKDLVNLYIKYCVINRYLLTLQHV